MSRLLFVEDDIVAGCIYRHHFTSAGYEVELAQDGERALAALTKSRPDIVVLDLLLPKLDGVQILKRIRATPDTASLPVIVFTSAFASGLAREAEKAGATRCLPRVGTGVSELLEAIRSSLTSAGATEPKRAALASATMKQPAGRSPAETAAVVGLDAREEFQTHAPQALAEMRRLSQSLLTEPNADTQATLILRLEIAVHSLTSSAALAQANALAHMASALDVFFKELYEKPKNLNASAVRTVHQGTEFLGELFRRASDVRGDPAGPFRILIVDDEAIARKAVSTALARARLSGVSVEDPAAAVELLRKEPFQLVISDVMMPAMNGFEFCQKMRALPGHAATPVIFGTALDGFQARIRSAQSGGTDFIAKPFSLMELAVKALMHLLGGQLRQATSGFQPLGRKSSQ